MTQKYGGPSETVYDTHAIGFTSQMGDAYCGIAEADLSIAAASRADVATYRVIGHASGVDAATYRIIGHASGVDAATYVVIGRASFIVVPGSWHVSAIEFDVAGGSDSFAATNQATAPPSGTAAGAAPAVSATA